MEDAKNAKKIVEEKLTQMANIYRIKHMTDPNEERRKMWREFYILVEHDIKPALMDALK